MSFLDAHEGQPEAGCSVQHLLSESDERCTCQLNQGLSGSLEEHALLSRVSDKDPWPCDRSEGHSALELGLQGHTNVSTGHTF